MESKRALLSNPDLRRIGHLYGLIGYPVSHSFSQRYFTEKFNREGLSDHAYTLFPLEDIQWFPELLESYHNLRGLNVTIPYKQQVMSFLDELDEGAAAAGAVNVIRIRDGKTRGYNSDVYGFERSLEEFLGSERSKVRQALVLGTGGASKAVAYVLRRWGIPHFTVSRSNGKGNLTYSDIDVHFLQATALIINTTPLGMSPEIDKFPELPYDHLDERHFLFDLVYNPARTVFMQKGEAQGARVCNGMAMLHYQAEKAWEYWNEA